MLETHQKRAIAIKLQENVEQLFSEIQAIHDITKDWLLDNVDLYLPGATAVKEQVAAYDKLFIYTIDMRTWLRDLRSVESVIPDGAVFPATSGVTFPSDPPMVL